MKTLHDVSIKPLDLVLGEQLSGITRMGKRPELRSWMEDAARRIVVVLRHPRQPAARGRIGNP